jgi:hypothetical protein
VRSTKSHSFSGRARLFVERLGERVVPTGLITASLSASGVLSLVGDDLDNVLTKITVTGANVVLTPDVDTAINNPANPGVQVALPGSVKSIKADFHGGNDAIAFDPTADFVMSGAASIILGDGNNTLDMITTQQIALSGLTVKGGDGTDAVTIRGGAGKGSLIGATSMSFLNGGSNTILSDLKFTAGLTLSATDAVAISNNVDATNVTVIKTFSASLGTSTAALVSFNTSTLGGLKESGYIIGALLKSTTVKGNIAMKGGFQADLQVDTATVTGNAGVSAPNASMEATGGGTTINGGLSLTAAAYTQASFETTTLTQVLGNITVKGGWFSDTFETNGFFKAGKNVSMTLGGGDNIVRLGDGTAPIAIGGNLSVKGGAGVDEFTFDRVAVTGTAAVLAYGGADLLSIEDGSTFAKTFSADMSTGDDTISIAQKLGSPGPVTFTGTAKIQAGVGNDFLLLGVDVGSGGDANSKAVFNGLGSFIDGGIGFDTFDPSSAQFTGLTPASW